jgi:hypothetical protein
LRLAAFVQQHLGQDLARVRPRVGSQVDQQRLGFARSQPGDGLPFSLDGEPAEAVDG